MSAKRILIVDDNRSALKVLKAILEEAGYIVYTEAESDRALSFLRKEPVHVALLDLKMPDMDGLELYRHIKQINGDVIVIIMTAYGNIESAVESMKLGIENYLQKPLNFDELKITLAKIFEKIEMKEELAILKGQIDGKNTFENMIGKSKKMRDIFRKIQSIAQFDSTVLITGESGTGKEMVAKAIHNLSKRKNNKMISINLAAIPEGLQESELFGYQKGAFTGAYASKPGKFEAAESGTIFLDEVGNINQKAQVKLLRVLEDRKVEPLGSNKTIDVDVRIISATNSDLKSEVEQGNFREDLYYRLNVISLNLPPLRERKSDIPLIAEQLIKEVCLRNNLKVKEFSDDAMEMLIEYQWPGNIRELRNVIEEAVVISSSDLIAPLDLNLSAYSGIHRHHDEDVMPFNMPLSEMEKRSIVNALTKTRGNQTHAAKLLGITRKILMNKIEKYNVTDIVPVRTKRKKMS
jgi:DNA-binding NtrC family response regulator